VAATGPGTAGHSTDGIALKNFHVNDILDQRPAEIPDCG
jgi:hypothetical protein